MSDNRSTTECASGKSSWFCCDSALFFRYGKIMILIIMILVPVIIVIPILYNHRGVLSEKIRKGRMPEYRTLIVGGNLLGIVLFHAVNSNFLNSLESQDGPGSGLYFLFFVIAPLFFVIVINLPLACYFSSTWKHGIVFWFAVMVLWMTSFLLLSK